MSYEKVAQAQEIIVGTKQTLKALQDGIAREVVLASDADDRIKTNVLTAAQENSVPVHTVDSMKKLGKACGIEVGAAAVAIK